MHCNEYTKPYIILTEHSWQRKKNRGTSKSGEQVNQKLLYRESDCPTEVLEFLAFSTTFDGLDCILNCYYTVIDRLSSVNYKIQLIGTTKIQIVHRNRLKICYGDPERSSIQRESEQSLWEGECLESDEVPEQLLDTEHSSISSAGFEYDDDSNRDNPVVYQMIRWFIIYLRGIVILL